MNRSTIDYGIDLGTTNSAVAVLNGTEATVIKNNDDRDTTASAVYIDSSGAVHVGELARRRTESDPDNAATEFKLRMGLGGQPTRFRDSGRTMEPEDLSAEVLKSLRDDVAQRTGDDIGAAVITVPAAFELNQCEATRRAAERAGLAFAPLLQEPTAAALAYGFQSEEDNRFWLVYDLGGGTFDASIVHLRDGELSVVNHRGDNFLGGKLIDWAIVEQLLIPAVTGSHPLTNFGRGERRWIGAVAKLKLAAEEAKIALSRREASQVMIDYLCEDDDGRRVSVDLTIRREQVEQLALPFLTRSVHLCRTAVDEAGLAATDIDRVLLVGGPTLSPQLRAVVQAELGIDVDVSQDPLTVVARGAAIFAGTQRLPAPSAAASAPGTYMLDLEYSPIGADVEPFVGGRVTSPAGEPVSGLTLQFHNPDAEPEWRSGKVPLNVDGSFVTSLFATRGRRNQFRITLADITGRSLPVAPDTLHYTVGTVESEVPLTQTIGLGLSDREMLPVLSRGAPLPSRGTAYLRTTTDVQRGSGLGLVRIPVLEGEHTRADRNRRIGTLEVMPDDLSRDLPAGSEVEVTIEIDASRMVVARAYVPFLDQEFDRAIDLTTEVVPDAPTLSKAVDGAQSRYATLRARASGDPGARALLEEIESENLADELDSLVAAAEVDVDAATTAGKRVLDLEARLDEVEETLRWPALVSEAAELLPLVREAADTLGTPQHRQLVDEAERLVQQALDRHDHQALAQRLDRLRDVYLIILREAGILDVQYFRILSERRDEMTDQPRAATLIGQGSRAIANNETTVLASINRQLVLLLPSPPPEPDPFSTVERDTR